MELPHVVRIGPDAIFELGDELSKLGKGKAIVVTSQTSMSLFGQLLTKVLTSSGIESDIYVVQRGTDINGECEQIISRFVSDEYNFVLGVGGGRTIDIGKMVAFRMKLLFASVPTTPSHDGIASPLVSIPDKDRRYSTYAKTPSIIIADTNILTNAPHRHIASGAGDVLAKFTAVKDWRLAHLLKGEYYGDYAAKLAETSVEMVIREARNIGRHKEKGIRVLAEALINCGIVIGIVGNSRPCSGSEHLFSHSLDLVANYPALHGEQVGLGTIMMACLHNADWELIRDTLRTIGSPTSSGGLGISTEQLIEALTTSHKMRPDRYTILGESGITKQAAKNLAEETEVT